MRRRDLGISRACRGTRGKVSRLLRLPRKRGGGGAFCVSTSHQLLLPDPGVLISTHSGSHPSRSIEVTSSVRMSGLIRCSRGRWAERAHGAHLQIAKVKADTPVLGSPAGWPWLEAEKGAACGTAPGLWGIRDGKGDSSGRGCPGSSAGPSSWKDSPRGTRAIQFPTGNQPKHAWNRRRVCPEENGHVTPCFCPTEGHVHERGGHSHVPAEVHPEHQAQPGYRRVCGRSERQRERNTHGARGSG